MDKLKYYGADERALAFVEFYLSNRRQNVHVNGEWSLEHAVDYGVFQGSVLGLLLFLKATNDLPFSVAEKTFLYADYSTFLIINSDIDEF